VRVRQYSNSHSHATTSRQHLGGIPGTASTTNPKGKQPSLLCQFHQKNAQWFVRMPNRLLLTSEVLQLRILQDTCKIKAADLPSPRTDRAASEDKSQKMQLGSLNRI